MRFPFASLAILLMLPMVSAGAIPLGGDPIGPDSSTTDGNGAVRASRSGSGEYLGQPGVVFSLDGSQRLMRLRSIVTFINRNGGPIHVPQHRFWARLWTLENYLAGEASLYEIELGQPTGVPFQSLPGGSVVPRESFGAAGGNISEEWPAYDFRWDLSSHAAFRSPLPAGNYVLAVYSTSDVEAEGEMLVGISHEPAGLPPVFFANGPCKVGPGFLSSVCCPTSDLKWAIGLYVQEDSASLGPWPSTVWGTIPSSGMGDSLLAPMMFGSRGGFPGSTGAGRGGFPLSGAGIPRIDPLQSAPSTFFPDLTPNRFLPDDSFQTGSPNPPMFASDGSSDTSSHSITPTQTHAVPEPASWVLLGLGLMMLVAWQYAHRRAN